MVKSEWISSDKGFYIGDLCYVFDSNQWVGIVDEYYEDYEFGSEQSKYKHTIELNNGKLGMVNTKYGDGDYEDNNGRYYSVDSGSLGIVPIEMTGIDLEDADYNGKVVHGQGEARIKYDDGDVIVEFKGIGQEPITIQTGYEIMYGNEVFEDNWLA